MDLSDNDGSVLYLGCQIQEPLATQGCEVLEMWWVQIEMFYKC